MTSESYAPFRPGIDPAERGKQLRAMGAIAHMLFGLNCPLVHELRSAETDPEALARAHAIVEQLRPLHRRRLLATFSSVTWPPRTREKAPAGEVLSGAPQ
jgi:hypothetical protein